MHFQPFAVAGVLAALLALPAAAADNYLIDGVHSQPQFEVSHMGFSIQRGRFTKVSGTATLDVPAKKGSVALSIDVKSIDMGLPVWNQHVIEKFFDAEKHPSMTFQSDDLIFQGDTPVAAEGRLTLRGVTRPVILTLSNFKCGTNPMNKKAMCGAEASLTIKRSDYGMSYALPNIGDDIRISAPVEAYRN